MQKWFEFRKKNSWTTSLGKGINYLQGVDRLYFTVGANDLDLRPTVETNFSFYREDNEKRFE